MKHLRIKTDANGTLDEVEVQQATIAKKASYFVPGIITVSQIPSPNNTVTMSPGYFTYISPVVGMIISGILEYSGEKWSYVGEITAVPASSNISVRIITSSSLDSLLSTEYTGTFELPGFQSSASDIIMDSITFTSATNTFTSVGVTPVVGLPVSGTYRRTTNNRFYKWVGTITSISGSTVTITATNGGYTSQSYQHNIFIRSTDNFNNICFSFIHTNSIALTTISAISGLLLGEGFNSAYKLVPATGSQRITISAGEYAAANVIGIWANSTGSNLMVKRSYIKNGSYVIEGTALSTSESFEINDIVIAL